MRNIDHKSHNMKKIDNKDHSMTMIDNNKDHKMMNDNSFSMKVLHLSLLDNHYHNNKDHVCIYIEIDHNNNHQIHHSMNH